MEQCGGKEERKQNTFLKCSVLESLRTHKEEVAGSTASLHSSQGDRARLSQNKNKMFSAQSACLHYYLQLS